MRSDVAALAIFPSEPPTHITITFEPETSRNHVLYTLLGAHGFPTTLTDDAVA